MLRSKVFAKDTEQKKATRSFKNVNFQSELKHTEKCIMYCKLTIRIFFNSHNTAFYEVEKYQNSDFIENLNVRKSGFYSNVCIP